MADENIAGELGAIDITDDVIKSISGMAVAGVKGVAGMRGGVWVGLREATTGRKDYSKGVEVKRLEGNSCAIDLFIVVDHDAAIVDVSKEAQKVVKERVEDKVGKTVRAVNVHVVDIRFPGQRPGEEQP
ncbi:MAG: Asp23/Gls24 family envelope stress response protein [bacterium]